MKKKNLEQTWENLRWVNRVLEENRVEWRREMKEQKQVTRKEKKRKYKKKEQFRKELDQIRTSIYNLQQIPEMEEPEDRPDGWKEEEKHPEGWKKQKGWSQDEDKIEVTADTDEDEKDTEGWKDGDEIEMQMFGYYVDMKRAHFDANSRIIALEIVDDCIKHINREKEAEINDVNEKGGPPPPSSTPCQDTGETICTPPTDGGCRYVPDLRTTPTENNPDGRKRANKIMLGFVEIRSAPQPMQSLKIMKKGKSTESTPTKVNFKKKKPPPPQIKTKVKKLAAQKSMMMEYFKIPKKTPIVSEKGGPPPPLKHA